MILKSIGKTNGSIKTHANDCWNILNSQRMIKFWTLNRSDWLDDGNQLIYLLIGVKVRLVGLQQLHGWIYKPNIFYLIQTVFTSVVGEDSINLFCCRCASYIFSKVLRTGSLSSTPYLRTYVHLILS